MAKRKMEVRGFTLIELMIVVAVIGILASIAYPAYEDSVRKANRRAAQGFMLDIANREQLFFLDNRAYTATIKPPGGLNLPTPSELDKPDPGKRYDFAVDPNTPAGPPPCFTITATARNRQVPDGDMTLDCRGAKTRGGVAGW